MVAASASLELDDSAIFKLLEKFSKDLYMSKNIVSKSKANYISSCILYIHNKEKNSQEINIAKLSLKWCASLIEALQQRHF